MSNQNWNPTTPDPGQDPDEAVPGYQPPQTGEPDAPQGYQPPASAAEEPEVPPAYQPPASTDYPTPTYGAPAPGGYPPPASGYEPPAAYPPASPPYGQPPAAPYGQPPATPYGQPSADYGQPAPGGYPPATPYGQPSAPYGQPPAGGYPPVPYGQPTGYPAAGYGVGNYPMPAGGAPLADWGKRALGAVIDYGPISVLSGIGNTLAAGDSGFGSIASFILGLAGLAWLVWNTGYKAGTTGVSFGRSIAGTKLVAEATGQPVGVGLAIIRYIAHFIDSLLCMIGWFMPLWDSKRQTIADKIMKTVVLDTSADPNPTKFEWK